MIFQFSFLSLTLFHYTKNSPRSLILCGLDRLIKWRGKWIEKSYLSKITWGCMSWYTKWVMWSLAAITSRGGSYLFIADTWKWKTGIGLTNQPWHNHSHMCLIFRQLSELSSYFLFSSALEHWALDFNQPENAVQKVAVLFLYKNRLPPSQSHKRHFTFF